MLAVSGDVSPIDDIGGLIIVLFCLALIAFGKDSATVNAVLFTVIGKIFGKYQKKEEKIRAVKRKEPSN